MPEKNAIWPFTVVGRPPQEDTSFGQLIHEIAGNALQQEIPGLKEVHAVDAAGVHPLLLAIGSERYTPYAQTKQPAEILTIANHILGTGQLSLAKFLFITADDTNKLSTHHIEQYLQFILREDRPCNGIFIFIPTLPLIHWIIPVPVKQRQQSGICCLWRKHRVLATAVLPILKELSRFVNPQLAMPGVLVLQTNAFTNYETAATEMNELE